MELIDFENQLELKHYSARQLLPNNLLPPPPYALCRGKGVEPNEGTQIWSKVTEDKTTTPLYIGYMSTVG